MLPSLSLPPALDALRVAALLGVLAVATVIDLRRGVIPNALNLCGLGLGLAGLIAPGAPSPVTALAAAGAAALALLGARGLGVVLTGQPGVGLGDVKLAVVLEVFLGWSALWALYLAVVVGAVVGLAGQALGWLRPRQRVPFAPFIGAGVLLHLCVLPPEFVLGWGWP